jgi:hypothetical protein
VQTLAFESVCEEGEMRLTENTGICEYLKREKDEADHEHLHLRAFEKKGR